MKTFLDEHCEFAEWSKCLIEQCANFSCVHDKDIEHFFKDEFEEYDNQLLGKSYGFIKSSPLLQPVAAFTVSNSMLPVSVFPHPIKNRINRTIPNAKRNAQYPAVLIGQLVVFDRFSGKQIGDEVLSFIKSWFISPLNKTGCRYILVDAANNDKVLDFYLRNGFRFIFDRISDEIEYMKLDLEPAYKRTRFMYFDLIVLKA